MLFSFDSIQSGYTPLHLAAMFDHKEVMELLIKGYGRSFAKLDDNFNTRTGLTGPNSDSSKF